MQFQSLVIPLKPWKRVGFSVVCGRETVLRLGWRGVLLGFAKGSGFVYLRGEGNTRSQCTLSSVDQLQYFRSVC